MNPYESPQKFDKQRRGSISFGLLEVVVVAMFAVCVLWFLKALVYSS